MKHFVLFLVLVYFVGNYLPSSFLSARQTDDLLDEIARLRAELDLQHHDSLYLMTLAEGKLDLLIQSLELAQVQSQQLSRALKLPTAQHLKQVQGRLIAYSCTEYLHTLTLSRQDLQTPSLPDSALVNKLNALYERTSQLFILLGEKSASLEQLLWYNGLVEGEPRTRVAVSSGVWSLSGQGDLFPSSSLSSSVPAWAQHSEDFARLALRITEALHNLHTLMQSDSTQAAFAFTKLQLLILPFKISYLQPMVLHKELEGAKAFTRFALVTNACETTQAALHHLQSTQAEIREQIPVAPLLLSETDELYATAIRILQRMILDYQRELAMLSDSHRHQAILAELLTAGRRLQLPSGSESSNVQPRAPR